MWEFDDDGFSSQVRQIGGDQRIEILRRFRVASDAVHRFDYSVLFSICRVRESVCPPATKALIPFATRSLTSSGAESTAKLEDSTKYVFNSFASVVFPRSSAIAMVFRSSAPLNRPS